MVSLLPQTKKICSIEINAEGIAFACAQNSEITACSFTPCKDNIQLKQCLMDVVLKNNLKKTTCNWVLHPDQYHLTLVNTPNVPQFEYKNAVRWQVKDIISYPLEDVAIEIFYRDDLEKRPKKIYVVAAQSSFLQKTIGVIKECHLQPTAIDIREFAIRNLVTNLVPENELVGFLDITEESCLVVIVQQNRIQFVRQVPLGINKIKTDNYNELTNELQRSFNYCSSELKQTIPAMFFLPPSAYINPDIAQNIAKILGKEMAVLNLQKMLRFTTPISPETEAHCWAAIGGVLRK
ncbi:MAG: hypothetical protein ACD_21C00072G0025 [uncultured bacterium]|nr:MAG: hypothetical protein ACD_21C00072G0025 [uncultured bacterium]